MSKSEREEIQHLAALMREESLTKISIKKEGLELVLEKGAPAAPVAAAPLNAAPAAAPAAPSEPESGVAVTSPMVGTFYAAPSPTDAPYVKVGDTVTADTVVCIVEAMKVMNEVKAGCAGVIKEVYVGNGDPVEYGSKLFRVE